MARRVATALVAAAALAPLARAGDNGRAVKPPMGWRTWNQYQTAVSQDVMMASFDVLTDRSRTIWNGTALALADLGFSDAGLDDAWQACGAYGPSNYTYHNATGYPMVNLTRFPNMQAMNEYAHSKGLTTGWYGNNCMCHDHCTDPLCFAADVDATLALGWDSTKLDGCGAEENIELWYDLFEWAVQTRGGKTDGGQPGVLIENCHNGGGSKNQPSRDQNGDLWCPFNMYRSSTDIRPVFGSILVNLNTVPAIASSNLSVPGCWAYPDMLEVGVTNTQGGPPPLSLSESRAHFSAWCVVSAPLILGFNLTDTDVLDSVWPIITNTEAIAVNQDYAGFSGTIFWSSSDQVPFTPCGWWSANCTFPSRQYLYKPLSNGDTAVVMMNNANSTSDLALTIGQVPGLSASASYKVRDLWAHADVGTFSGTYTAAAVGGRDAAFLRLSPA